MSSKLRPSKVERWAHTEAGGEAEVEAEVAAAFRTLADEEPMDQATLAAVGRRIAQQARPGARRPLRHLPLVLAVLTCGTGAAFAQFGSRESWSLQQLFAPRAKAAKLVAATTPSRSNDRPSPSAVAVLGGVAVPGVPSPAPAQSLPAEPSAPALIATRAPTPPSQLAQESEQLQRALAKLRRDHDAAATLALLDDYATRFPRGVLSLEASVARVDALLLAGRRADALARLAQLPLDRVGRRLELQLVRAELYAERDCSKALLDFAAVLAAGASGGLGERALYGRATCRLRLGDAAGGDADLEAYLSRYPKGRFSDQIRARIGKL